MISQGYSKIQIFQKKNSFEALEADSTGSNLGKLFPLRKKQNKESLTEVVT
jgi:hypothetical protein